MTSMAEPQHAVNRDDVERSDPTPDGELTTLVRRWMAAESTAQSTAQSTVESRVRESADVVELGNGHGVAPREEPDVSPQSPALPRRTTGTESEPVRRTALLVDARRESVDAVAGLLARLAGRSSVTVCRAYGDWSRSDLGEWVGCIRRDVLHSFHHFADDDEQALVAMAIDAVDIARDAGVDEVVIAGDLTSSLPLVHRLRAAGVRVVAAGGAHTPYDVRAACDEFIDTESIDADIPVGRHRA